MSTPTVVVASSETPPGKTQIRFAAKNCKNREVGLALYWAAGDIPVGAAQECIEGFPSSLPESTKGRKKKQPEATETPAV